MTEPTSEKHCPYPGEDPVACPACGTTLEAVVAVDDGNGTRVRCPHCERSIDHVIDDADGA